MPDFSKAKVGDRVYSLLRGWGAVSSRWEHGPVVVDFCNDLVRYTLDGCLIGKCRIADLYWDEVTLNIPESAMTPPKRKVKKFATLRLDIIISGKPPTHKKDLSDYGQFRLWDSIEDALEYLDGTPHKCRGPFEIEVEI